MLVKLAAEARWCGIQTAMELYWYVLKKGNTFKVANIDPQGAIRYHKEGWELQERNPFKTPRGS